MGNNFYFTFDESNHFLPFPWCFILNLVTDLKNQVITETLIKQSPIKYNVSIRQIQIKQYFQLIDGWYISDRMFKYRMSDVVFLQESKIWDVFIRHADYVFCIINLLKTVLKCLCTYVLHTCYFVENKIAFLIKVHYFSAAILSELFIYFFFGWNNNRTVLNH